jgi:hypothetical protein
MINILIDSRRHQWTNGNSRTLAQGVVRCAGRTQQTGIVKNAPERKLAHVGRCQDFRRSPQQRRLEKEGYDDSITNSHATTSNYEEQRRWIERRLGSWEL